jgi:hypothetical protein
MLASSFEFNTYIGIEHDIHVYSPRVAKNQYVEHLILMANYCYCHAPHTSLLQIVPLCEGPNKKFEGFAKEKQNT